MPDTKKALKADITTLYQMNTDLANENEQLRAAIKGYEIMLTHFEHFFLTENAKLRAVLNA